MGSRGVFQPVGQKRLTNIAVVRLKKNGNRFEIACYRNKVQDWRVGIEKDVDEVLQTTAVFSNVSKGVLAKEKDLQAAFGTTDQKKICLEILVKGDLQVAEEERKLMLDNLFKDVAGVLVEKCINPETGRPYTLALLERALKDSHFNVDPKRSAKQQALEAIPLLQEKFPIQRANMRLKLSVPQDYMDDLRDQLQKFEAAMESSDILQDRFTCVVQVDPGVFRQLHNFMSGTTKGAGRVEVISFAVTAEGVSADEFAAASTSHVPQHSAAFSTASSSHASRPATSTSTPVVTSYHEQSGGSSSAAGSAAAVADLAQRTRKLGLQAGAGAGSQAGGEVVCSRRPISQLPEEHASRKERFAELDTLQSGWEVELRKKGDTVEAVFFAPCTGECVGAYAVARRQALAASKAAR